MKSVLVADSAKPPVGAAGAIGLSMDLGGQPMSLPNAAPAQRDIADRLARAVIIVLFSFMAVRLGADFLATGRLTGLLLLASEGLVVVLTLFRRAPAAVDRSMRARVLTTMSLLGPPLVRPAALAPLAPELVTVAISALGLLVVIGGKLSLGRSFGLIPANRGIVSTGLYKVVRHPIYLGYLVTHFAFVAANPTVWNIALLVTADIALMARAVCEEETLARDDEYRAYQTRVRWRVVPGVF
jgi:protein-S-isoprenylcysteine O-methyltransferase Ste14